MSTTSDSIRWPLAVGVLIAALAAVIAIISFFSKPTTQDVLVVSPPEMNASSAAAAHPAPSSSVPASSMPAPVAGAVVPASAPAPDPTTGGSAGSMAWTLPTGWNQIATKPMRVASFAIASGAECGLFIFPTGGDRLANVNRWRGQAGLPPIAEVDLAKELNVGTCGFGAFQWLPVRGPGKSFLAAIVPTPVGQAFVKLEAPGERLDALRDGFLAFTTSLRPSAAP